MMDIGKNISERLKALEHEIVLLGEERRLLKMAESLRYQKQLLRPDDVINARTAHKFAVLAEVASYLDKNEYNRKHGASAASIYQQIWRKFPKMSSNTFRSQLTRFRSEGRLNYSDNEATWRLAKGKDIKS